MAGNSNKVNNMGTNTFYKLHMSHFTLNQPLEDLSQSECRYTQGVQLTVHLREADVYN